MYVAFVYSQEEVLWRVGGKRADSVRHRPLDHYTLGVPPPVALAKHEAASPDHRSNPNIVVFFREPALHRRLVLEAMTGRAELPDRSVNHEWESVLDEAPDTDVPLRRQGRLAISPSSGFLCCGTSISPTLFPGKLG